MKKLFLLLTLVITLHISFSQNFTEVERIINPFAYIDPIPKNLTKIKKEIGYPKIAREAGLEGSVQVHISICKKGKYQSHEFEGKIHPIFRAAINKHIHKLKFKPATRFDKPIPSTVIIPFTFEAIIQYT